MTIPPGQAFVDITITPVDDNLFEGPETLTLTLADSGSYDVGSPASATVTIADNDPPDTTITSGPASPTAGTSAQFTFTGSQPVSALAGFECSLDSPQFAPCASPVGISGLSEGTHTFAVRAVDRAGHVDPTPASTTWVVDLTPPSVALKASLTSLWPANGKLVADTIWGSIGDAAAGLDPSSLKFKVIDGSGLVQPTGSVTVAADGHFTFVVSLEASRLGSDHDGRSYQIVVSAADTAGNATSASITVVVPHDQGK